jgi:hypothetical protein
MSLVEFMQQGTSEKLLRAIEKKGYGVLISGAVLLHDNVHLDSPACTQEVLEHFNLTTSTLLIQM